AVPRASAQARADHVRTDLLERLRGRSGGLAPGAPSPHGSRPRVAVGDLVPVAPHRHVRATDPAGAGVRAEGTRRLRPDLRRSRSRTRRAPGLPRTRYERQRLRDRADRARAASALTPRPDNAPHGPDVGVHPDPGTVFRGVRPLARRPRGLTEK